jgi:hypothetical protein
MEASTNDPLVGSVFQYNGVPALYSHSSPYRIEKVFLRPSPPLHALLSEIHLTPLKQFLTSGLVFPRLVLVSHQILYWFDFWRASLLYTTILAVGPISPEFAGINENYFKLISY